MKLDNIYTQTLAPYKRKRLFFSGHFRLLYERQLPGDWTQLQYEYKISTQCWLQRVNAEDIFLIMRWWYTKHHIKPNFWRLRHAVIPDTYTWTRPFLKAQRKAENARAKARRVAKALAANTDTSKGVSK